MATSAYGEPRATHDVDLVARMAPSHVGPFVTSLADAFYADADVVMRAVRRSASFNVIHFETTEKIDVFCVSTNPFARHDLTNRRMLELLDGRMVPVAAPDDMVVEKLRWFRRGGEVSERQLRDVSGVIRVMGDQLDIDRMRHWAEHEGVLDLLERVMEEAGR